MDNAQHEAIQQWLLKSQRDLKVANILIDNEESLLDAVVYHCQQCAEKALKAYLGSAEKVRDRYPPSQRLERTLPKH